MRRIILSLWLLATPSFAAHTVTQGLETFEGLVAGQAPDSTHLNNSLFGCGGTWNLNGNGTIWASNTVATISYWPAPLFNPLKLSTGTQAGTGQIWFLQNNSLNDGSYNGIQFTPNAGAKRMSCGFFFYGTVTDNNAHDMATITSGTGEFIVCKWLPNGGNPTISLEYPESPGPDAATGAAMTQNKVYWFSLLYDISDGVHCKHAINIYDGTSLILIGGVALNTNSIAQNNPASSIKIGCLNNQSNGDHNYFAFKDLIIDTNSNAAFPLMPGSCVANTPASADVQAAINFMDQGDRFVVPCGTNVWTSQVTISYLSGSGTSVGGGFTMDTAPVLNNRTLFTNNIDLNTPALLLTLDPTNFFTVSNLDFATWVCTLNGNVEVKTVETAGPFVCARFTSDKFYVSPMFGATNTYNALLWAGVYGLADNLYFRDTNVDSGSGHGISVSYDANVMTATNWHIAQSYGTTNCVTIESCIFDYEGTDDNCMDCFAGTKFTFRYNRMTNTWPGWHGADTDPRSPRLWEVYHNTNYSKANARGAYTATKMFSSRGGSGVCYSNYSDAGWNGATILSLRQYRAAADFNGQQYSGTAGFLPSGGLQGNMNGSRNVDGNQAGTGYPGLDQNGRGSFTVNPVVWTSTFTVGNYESLEPIYQWGNSVNGNTSSTATATDFDGTAIPTIIQANRDYYDNTPKPGYTALLFPWPNGPIVPYTPAGGSSSTGMGTVGAGGSVGAGGRVGL